MDAGVAGHTALGGFDAVEAAEASGDANGAAAVAAGGKGAEECGSGCRCAAAGAARGVVGIPGVATMVAEAVFAHADEGELGGIGLSKDDGARIFHPFDDGGVLVGYAVFEQEGAGGSGDALGHLGVFDGDGEAVERAEVVASHYGVLGSFGGGEGLVVGDEEVGVELGIQAVDTFEEEFGEFYGGNLLG